MSSTMFKLPALLSFKGTTSLCRWEHAGCVLPRGDGCSTRRVRVAHVATFAQHAGCVLGGSSGAASAMMHPKSRVSQVKRLIGRKFSDPDVQKELKMLAVETSEGPDRPVYLNVAAIVGLKPLRLIHDCTATGLYCSISGWENEDAFSCFRLELRWPRLRRGLVSGCGHHARN
ncbi:hypothetical protein S83_057444 [Arachis hypogaea]